LGKLLSAESVTITVVVEARIPSSFSLWECQDNEIKRVCTNNPRLLILAINSIFKKKHSLSAKVVFLDKEQNSGDSEKIHLLIVR